MIIDSSAIVAIFLKEPGHEVVLDKLIKADVVGVGTPTLAETAIVLTVRLNTNTNTNTNPVSLLNRFVTEFGIRQIPFAPEHWQEAAEAYSRYGKGRHPAALNFGDCLTYAVAKLSGQPLLYVGEDFSKTDLL